jgi:hypothetical protein
LPSSVEATSMGLYLIVGSIPRYLLRVSMRHTCSRMVHLTGFFIPQVSPLHHSWKPWVNAVQCNRSKIDEILCGVLGV